MTTPTTWVCPNCRRRVPRYAPVCHCGTRRTDAEAAGPTGNWLPQQKSLGWRDVPASGWLLLFLSATALITFVVLLFIPLPPPEPMIPLIGYVERSASTPVKR
jgi:hypothetical protein